MAPIEKIGAVPRNVFNPVEAVRLYETTNKYVTSTVSDNPFKGTVSWGLFGFNVDGPGQPNGGTKPEYHEDGSVYEPKTFCWA